MQLTEKVVSNGFFRRFSTFGAIGFGLMILGFILLETFVFIGLNANYANFFQAVICVELNFLLNNYFTWKQKVSWERFTRYHLAKFVLSVPLNQVIFVLLTSFFGINHQLSYIASIVLMTIVNYMINDRFVFVQKK